MKQIIFTIVLITFLYSCKKDTDSSYNQLVKGRWEYIVTEGYGVFPPPLPSGNGKIIVFGEDGTFERRSHDTVIFKGQYKLEKRKDCYGDDKKIFLNSTDTLFSSGNYISNNGDSLFINSPNCFSDGGISIYRKLY